MRPEPPATTPSAASIWAAATLLWTLVAASSPTETPLQALPFGAAQMGVAALLALGVWRLTAAVPWAPHSIRFYVVHGAAMAAFAVLTASTMGRPGNVRAIHSRHWPYATGLV